MVVTDVLQFIILVAAVLIVIPLSFDKIGGVSSLFDATPEGFFRIVTPEYTWVFIVAFMLYNFSFLAGNWAYVQRYTCVKSPRDAKRVGWLFGVLYLISPILWMLPPMIYRVFNPALSGLENENAYLLMCSEAMPSGLLGLMIGGMIFATASSLNATLNISAGVFTNDIYKLLRPATSEATLMKIARVSTIGFGVAAIVVAMLIPLMGGIVNVVISVGALTGVPLYLPLIWSLFTQRINSRILISVTTISLAINAIFKFITPSIFDFALNRAEEMVVGVAVPAIMLLGVELYMRRRNIVGDDYLLEAARADDGDSAEQQLEAEKSNKSSIFIIGLGALIAGVAITTLGAISFVDSVIPVAVGVGLLSVGGVIIYKNR